MTSAVKAHGLFFFFKAHGLNHWTTREVPPTVLTTTDAPVSPGGRTPSDPAGIRLSWIQNPQTVSQRFVHLSISQFCHLCSWLFPQVSPPWDKDGTSNPWLNPHMSLTAPAKGQHLFCKRSSKSPREGFDWPNFSHMTCWINLCGQVRESPHWPNWDHMIVWSQSMGLEPHDVSQWGEYTVDWIGSRRSSPGQ